MATRKGGATPKTGRAAPKGKTRAAKAKATPDVPPIHPQSSYRPEYAEQARKLCALGATDKELAEFFKVAGSTLSQWKIVHEAFAEALKIGKAEADDRVERSLYNRAVGYTFESEEVFCQNGQVTRVPVVKHVEPNVTAQIFWLKNRRRTNWRDKVDHEVTGKDGGPIEYADLSDEQINKRLAELMSTAAGQGGGGG